MNSNMPPSDKSTLSEEVLPPPSPSNVELSTDVLAQFLSIEQHRSLPDAAEISVWEEKCPGAADRFLALREREMAMMEKDQDHHHEYDPILRMKH